MHNCQTCNSGCKVWENLKNCTLTYSKFVYLKASTLHLLHICFIPVWMTKFPIFLLSATFSLVITSGVAGISTTTLSLNFYRCNNCWRCWLPINLLNGCWPVWNCYFIEQIPCQHSLFSFFSVCACGTNFKTQRKLHKLLLPLF